MRAPPDRSRRHVASTGVFVDEDSSDGPGADSGAWNDWSWFNVCLLCPRRRTPTQSVHRLGGQRQQKLFQHRPRKQAEGILARFEHAIGRRTQNGYIKFRLDVLAL